MDTSSAEAYEKLIRSAARRLKGHARRLFQAEVADALCQGSPRAAERRFGFDRNAVATGQHEATFRHPLRRGLPRPRQAALRGQRPPTGRRHPLPRRASHPGRPGAEVRPPLHQPVRQGGPRGAARARRATPPTGCPASARMRDILNRLGYRLKRIQKAKPLKKRQETDAIFANVGRGPRASTGTTPRRWRSRSTRRRR